MTDANYGGRVKSEQFKSRQTDRPQPRKPKRDVTVWLDYTTGRGVDDDGRPIEPIIAGRRKNPRLVDLLETARHHHARRLMLCGTDLPGNPADWLLPDERSVARGTVWTPGWTNEGHYLEAPGQGRFKHDETGARLAVLTVAEWFGEHGQQLPPANARDAWNTLEHVVATAIKRDWPLMRLPAQTGLNIWLLSAPDSYDLAHLDPDIGAQIQATEPQHRFQHYVDGPAACSCGDCRPLIPANAQLEAFVYADGRFMYHGAPSKELGGGPGRRLRGPEATELFEQTKGFAPARYLVRTRVPEFWDHIGLLPVQREAGRGWHWPNKPGAIVETWADAAEVRLAASMWGMPEILEGIAFTKSSPLRRFQDMVRKMLDYAAGLEIDGRPISPRRLDVVQSAVRQMYRITIGAMARRPRILSGFATDPSQVPENAVGAVREERGGWVYQVTAQPRPGDADTWHPEIAAMVWAASRVRVLQTPTAEVTRGPRAGYKSYGALEVPPEELIGIQGDAIYTTTIQDWTLPTVIGGGDDGRTGRIRIKGWLPGPVGAPATVSERQALSRQAETHGWQDAF